MSIPVPDRNSRPNHYFHDSLGDPAVCADDHNHPDPVEDILPPEVIEKAGEANCSRCGVQIVGAKSMLGTLMYNHYAPATGTQKRGFLCGECGLSFREFLYPHLERDELFQSVKEALQAKWDRE
jgi:hypothetical protein